MRVMVTGGAGFIGSNLVRMLLNRGHQVLNVDKQTYAGNLRSLEDVDAHPNYEYLQADIGDDISIDTALCTFSPGAVMHLAAETHVDKSIDLPFPFFETNVLGTVRLVNSCLRYWNSLEVSKKLEFRFLHISTDEVFGSLGLDGAFTEASPYAPRSPYAASKGASDHVIRAWFHTYGLPTLTTNCSNNYGPFQYPEKLVPLTILKCIREEPIPIYGNGQIGRG